MAKLLVPFVVVPKTFAPPAQQLIDAIAQAGMNPPASVVMDGRIHRFKASGGKDKSGWYVAFSDGVPAGRFGDWRTGTEQTWRAETGQHLTAAEEIAHSKRMAEIKALRDAEALKRHELAKDVVGQIWADLEDAETHPYLTRKGVLGHGTKVTPDGRLVCPLFDPATGELASLQYIDDDGGKLYHPGGETKGKTFQLGNYDPARPVYVVEGFATGATVHEVTGCCVVVSYSASNLTAAVGSIRADHPEADIVVVADNDQGGVGQRGAEQAIAKHGGRYVIPPTLGDANDYVQAGKDLNALLTPSVDNGWLIPADDFASQPAPIAWLVKGWLQAMALIMVHGPSGGGKTFLVLDWCLRMAAGMTEWHGVKVKPGPVVYLAGEGHHGLRKRVAAWKVKHQAGKLAMWLSRDGLNLNTVDGLAKTQSSIKALNVRPSLIVVDTLHRFLSGDENSAQDAKTMLDACAQLQSEFSCSVLLVHHTGVNEDAQGRARGSSAWRGALDIEVSVVPAKGDGPIGIVQRKSKDSEMVDPVYAELVDVPIPGWLDEDGEQVTGAVLCEAQAPLAPVKETPAQKHRKTAERAWWASGAEVRAGAPYISRAGLKAFLAEEMGWAPGTLAQHLKPSAEPGKFLRDLLDGGFFATHEHGWVISDPIRASALMLSRGSGN